MRLPGRNCTSTTCSLCAAPPPLPDFPHTHFNAFSHPFPPLTPPPPAVYIDGLYDELDDMEEDLDALVAAELYGDEDGEEGGAAPSMEDLQQQQGGRK